MLFIFQTAGTYIRSNNSQNTTHTGLKMMLAFVGEGAGCNGGEYRDFGLRVFHCSPASAILFSVRPSDGVSWHSTTIKNAFPLSPVGGAPCHMVTGLSGFILQAVLFLLFAHFLMGCLPFSSCFGVLNSLFGPIPYTL